MIRRIERQSATLWPTRPITVALDDRKPSWVGRRHQRYRLPTQQQATKASRAEPNSAESPGGTAAQSRAGLVARTAAALHHAAQPGPAAEMLTRPP
ncbi:UNVERIFIED_CONTAM: hypothetical protein K2H54_066940, partial [Gekko kuhli]